MEVKKDIMWRINISFILVCVFGLVILGQIFRIQFIQGAYWKQREDSLTTDIRPISASRGNIFSSDGKLLSTSVPIYDIRMDTRADGLSQEEFDANIDSLAISLSKLFTDRTATDFRHAISEARSQNDRYFLIRRNVHYPELQELKKFPLFRKGRYKGGLMVEQKEMREMPFQMLASRTIGYVRDVKPVGIEAAYNNNLEGISGKRLMQKISGGVWKPVTDKDEIEPKDGNDIVSTIDINFQDVAEHSLERHLKEHNADHGCAVLMEVATGEIKAIANLKRNDDGNYIEDFNYVIAEATEPGSTFKLASLLAGIEDGYIDPADTVFVGNGFYRYYNAQDMKDAHPPTTPRMSIQRAFETSSNVGVSMALWKSYVKKPEQFVARLRSFGLNTPLGIDIEGEGKPRIKATTDKDWTPLSLPWMSIGYEVKLTPLQILNFYNTIANNGRMVRPHFVRDIMNHGQVLRHFDTEILRDSILSPATLAKARELLEGVVQHGTAKELSKSPYKIAGKTGTAQMSRNRFGYDKENPTYQASFVGYFPADAPKYSCMVVVYAPSNDVYFGGAVAAPIFKEIADKVYSNHLELNASPIQVDSAALRIPFAKSGVQKDLKKVCAAINVPVNPKDGDAALVSTEARPEGVTTTERKVKAGYVPSVTGMGLRDAVAILENAGMRVRVRGRGVVTRQSVDPGTKILRGQIIQLDLGL